ncbi:MAG TPA: hypothetical protein GXX30_07115 [Firmicutes bacterium]|nr:hypothetical protein [Candidatus Fermentithermobacillaceae bacterium]
MKSQHPFEATPALRVPWVAAELSLELRCARLGLIAVAVMNVGSTRTLCSSGVTQEVGRKQAVIATARKLLIVAWRILLTGEPYCTCKVARYSEKLGALRRCASERPRDLDTSAQTPCGQVLSIVQLTGTPSLGNLQA